MMKVGTVTQCPFKLSNNSGKFKKLYDGKSKNSCHFAALKKGFSGALLFFVWKRFSRMKLAPRALS
jgi:hypothetical protein